MWGLQHCSYVWMVFGIIGLKQFVDWNYVSTICQFDKGMVNDGPSFGWDIISNVLNEIEIKNVVALSEDFFNNSDLLSGQENSKRIQVKVECVRRHGSGIIGIELLNVCVTRVQILNASAEQLELEFVIDFGKLIEPVHWFLSLSFYFYYLKLYKCDFILFVKDSKIEWFLPNFWFTFS